MSKRHLITAVATAIAALLLAIPVLAASRDGNDDSLPDQWEKRHDLSLNANQARRDQDGDHRRNRGEFRHGTDPRDADSDDDGTEDGAECAGGETDGVDSDDDGVNDDAETECDGAHDDGAHDDGDHSGNRGPGGGGHDGSGG